MEMVPDWYCLGAPQSHSVVDSGAGDSDHFQDCGGNLERGEETGGYMGWAGPFTERWMTLRYRKQLSSTDFVDFRLTCGEG